MAGELEPDELGAWVAALGEPVHVNEAWLVVGRIRVHGSEQVLLDGHDTFYENVRQRGH